MSNSSEEASGSAGCRGPAPGQGQVGHAEVAGVRVGPDLERVVGRAQVDGALVTESLRPRHGHVGRHVRLTGPAAAGDDRAERGLLRGVAGQRRPEIARLHPVGRGGVDRVLVMHGADDGEVLHHPGLAREALGDADARHGGGDRPVRPRELGRRVRLHVVGVLLAHAAVRPEDDQRLVRTCTCASPARGNSARPRPDAERPRLRKFRRLSTDTHVNLQEVSTVGQSARLQCCGRQRSLRQSVVEQEFVRRQQRPEQGGVGLLAVGFGFEEL